METPQGVGQPPLDEAQLLGGRYRLGERLGSGGMATIFRARDTALERDVAVKILHAHLAEDHTLQRRFRTEARHAASLLHPNIVNVFDQGVDEDAGLSYIVMEYVDGPSLRKILTERGRLTPGEAIAVLEPVCRALARAHSVGVVHRDVKPENILVAADGSPKLADFGIARAVAETGHTQTGALVGSVHYLAPELVAGEEATPASDQYALGVLAFELTTGRKPLPAESPVAVAARHTNERIPPPGDYVSDCTPAFDKAVGRATQQDPAKRYPDLAGFASALISAVPGGAQPVELASPEADTEGTVIIPATSVETITLARGGGGDTGSRFTRSRRARRRPTRRRARRGSAAAAAPASADHTAQLDNPAAAAGRRRRRSGRVGGVLVLGLLLLAGGGGFAVWNYAVAPVTTVPGVTQLPEADAAAQLQERGLEMVVDARRHNFDVAEGTVLTQDPSEGAQLRAGDGVSVVVSAGPAEVTMPEVVGMREDAALRQLKSDDYRFVVRQDYEHSPTVAPGVVQAQQPPPGTTLDQGQTVVINTSLGVRQVTVPDVSGLQREEALTALEEAELQGELAFTYSDAVPQEGRVVSQSVEPGTEVDVHSVVTVTVSRGPATIEVPDVEDEPVGDAVAELQDLGFSPRVIEEPRPQLGPFRRGRTGFVEAQDPQPGTAYERGSQIDLYTFSKHAEDDD